MKFLPSKWRKGRCYSHAKSTTFSRFLECKWKLPPLESLKREKVCCLRLKSCLGCFSLNCEIIISFCVLMRYLGNFSSKFLSSARFFPTLVVSKSWNSSLYCKLCFGSRGKLQGCCSVAQVLLRLPSGLHFSVRKLFASNTESNARLVECKTTTKGKKVH